VVVWRYLPTQDVVRKTLEDLLTVFKHVAFVPGNHDLWVVKHKKKVAPHSDVKTFTSLVKQEQLLALCDELGVITRT
jgi:UDP-2,3-diacylglucosamine pyrophosphatase LpxH